jgi:hypothetical protein
MDHSVEICGLIIFVVFAYQFWYDNFSRVNKMTDEQLINGYIELKRTGRIK